MTAPLEGIFPPITTPFDADGSVLLDRLRENLRRWADTGLAGILLAGSNGEGPSLSDDEKLAMVREARPLVARGKTLMVGAGGESTRLTIEFIRKLADLGVDYALVGVPCYFKAAMNDETLYVHFSTIADRSPIPILVYNVPQFTGVACSAALIERLAAHTNVAGLKESSANLALQAEVRRRVPERFRILVGAAPTLLPSLIQGASGGIVAIACALPGMTVDLYRTFRAGDWKAAARLQAAIAPAAAAVTTQFGVPGLKAAMELTGYFGGPPRLPLRPLGEAQRESLRGIFNAAGAFASA